MLEDLLRASREHNASHGISGLLLFRDGCFMQLIEGSADEIRQLYDRIRRDPRHENVTTLDEGPRRERDFPDWSMGFRDLRSPEVRQMPGFSEFLETPLTERELAGRVSHARRILLAFKRDR